MKLKGKTFEYQDITFIRSIFFSVSQDQICSKSNIYHYLSTDESVKISRLIYSLFYLQVRDRLKRKMNAIFPAVLNENPAKETITLQDKRSHVGVPKKIEVLPYRNNTFELKQ